ncbi:Small COPII coat GTPase sar1 [Pelomyxa schiedti]|nr:Small COPII coat GTPase sar1 [Pelomyxa schiedti]
MFFVDWVYWALNKYFGFWEKKATLLLLGLDNAGKTTLLYKLKNDTITFFSPTQRPSLEQLRIGTCTLTTYDLGGHKMVREMWRDYFMGTDAIVFMVDAADTARIPEAQAELAGLLQDSQLNDIPIAVFGNKCDIWDKALPGEEFVRSMGLEPYLSPGNTRPVRVFMTSLVQGTGYPDGLEWLVSQIGN